MHNAFRPAAQSFVVALALCAMAPLSAAAPASAPLEPAAPLQHAPSSTRWVEWLPDAATIKARGGDPQAIEERGRIEVEIQRPRKIAARADACREIGHAFESGWVESFPPALLYSGGRLTYAFWRGETEPLEATVRAIQSTFGTYESTAGGAAARQRLCLIGSNVGSFLGTPVEGLHFRDAEKHDHIVMFLLGAAAPELRKKLAEAPAYAASLPDPKALLITIDAGATFTVLEPTAATPQPIP
jgi:hypothetical protein